MLKRYQISGSKIVESIDEKSPILVFIAPNESEQRHLIDDYKIDEHTLHSAIDPDELAWLEFEPNHLALIFKRPQNYSGKDQLLFKSSTTGLFLFADRLIIVLLDDIPLFENKIFAKIHSLTDITLKLIYSSIFHFLKHLKVVNMISDELEQKINKSMENRYLISLFTLQKSLVYYLDAINSNSVLVEKLKINTKRIEFSQEQLELLEDITVENNQCYKQAEIYSNVLASLMDARASIVSNNLNILIKVLNIITISIMVPTLIVSIFSMNVRLPIEDVPHAFWIILGLSAISMLSVLFIWKRKKL
ncbi:MAG: magnesium transporter CorA family protein [Candidatus Stahlbacteria bacterium]|nr:magnesium transporter CorA family protein [Candidatus Stahlbacteria bacterium]